MDRYIHIHWTCPSLTEAKRVATKLVEEKWVACAQIIPHIDSIFLWDGKLHAQPETKVIFKTKKGYFTPIKELIMENCSYEVPEILELPITDGNDSYLAWVEATLR